MSIASIFIGCDLIAFIAIGNVPGPTHGSKTKLFMLASASPKPLAIFLANEASVKTWPNAIALDLGFLASLGGSPETVSFLDFCSIRSATTVG